MKQDLIDNIEQRVRDIAQKRNEWIEYHFFECLGLDFLQRIKIKKRSKNPLWRFYYKRKFKDVSIRYHTYDTGVEIWFKGEKRYELPPVKFTTN